MYRYDFTKMAGTTEPIPAIVGIPNSDQMYNAIAHAETNYGTPGVSTWIRTKVRPPEGSTAYGPVQLTYRKARDYMARYGKELGAFNGLYNDFLVPQWKKFKHHGNNKGVIKDYNPIYDYGGAGDPISPANKYRYRGFSSALMDIDDREVRKAMPKGTPAEWLDGRIARWRGVSRNADPEYFDKVNRFLYTNYPELYKENK